MDARLFWMKPASKDMINDQIPSLNAQLTSLDQGIYDLAERRGQEPPVRQLKDLHIAITGGDAESADRVACVSGSPEMQRIASAEKRLRAWLEPPPRKWWPD
jgi:hypothetical protein